MRLLPIALVASAITFTAAGAHAQISGWTHVSGGAMGWRSGAEDPIALSPIMTIDAGVGSSFDEPFLLGGVFRVQPVFGHGVDLALLVRGATRGFQTDWVGIAIDLGAYQRLWDNNSTGFLGQAILGGPLGLQLAGFGSVGSHDTFGFGGTLGIDFARMVVYREHLLDWWPNHRPERGLTATR
jgi:hypothetical protein